MGDTLFWNNIVFLCSEKGVAPSVVATAVDLSASAAAKWKQGAIPQKSTLKKIGEYFGVPAGSLTITDYSATKPLGKNFKGEAKDIDVAFNSKGNSHRIPVLGRVSAGIPIEQIVDVEDWEDISAAMAQNGEYFALKIHGHSMEPRMCEGDVIIVRRQENVESGETAVVSINGQDATCKKIRHTTDGIMLISTNPQYEPMYYTNKQIQDLPITILGKVVEIRVKL